MKGLLNFCCCVMGAIMPFISNVLVSPPTPLHTCQSESRIGLDGVPDGDWYCHLCRHTKTPASSSIRIKHESAPSSSSSAPKKRKRSIGRLTPIEEDENGIIVLTDSDDEEEEDEEQATVPLKKHKCSLCGIPISDFDDLQVTSPPPPSPTRFPI
jgi:hypothetical protein